MNGLSRFEQLMEQLVETPFARLFKSKLHPADVAKKLARAMESGATATADGKIVVPNRYCVRMNPADVAEFEYRLDVEAEIAALQRYVSMLIQETGGTTDAPVAVIIDSDAAIARGEFSVIAETVAPAEPSSGDTKQFQPALPPPGHWRLRTPDAIIPLGMPIVRIGRDEANDIVLAHPTVSRFHAQLRWQNGVYFAENLSRTQPLGVNLKAVDARTPLKTGDTLQLGQVTLSVEIMP